MPPPARPRGVAAAHYGEAMSREPSSDLSQVEIDLLGLSIICWKCGAESVALVGIIPHEDGPEDELVRLSEPASLAFAAGLLPPGLPRVGIIKDRASRAAGKTYLSNGCVQCDALFGNFFLYHEEMLEVLVTEGVGGLEVLATVMAPMTDWQQIQDPDLI